MAAIPEHEVLYQLALDSRWIAAVDFLYQNHLTASQDPLLSFAAHKVISTGLSKPDHYFGDDVAEILEKIFFLHSGRLFILNDMDLRRLVEALVSENDSDPFRALIFARHCPESPVCQRIMERYGPPEITTVSGSDRVGADVRHHRSNSGTPASRSLFKSQQEIDFYYAVSNVLGNHLIYPNVALSVCMDFDQIKHKLSADERNYFFRGLIDCVVFDMKEPFHPLYFFELDSHYHDDYERNRRDEWKDRILSIAGFPLFRIRRPAHASGPDIFVDALRSIIESASV